MTRFYGMVGYGVPGELVGGVWTDTITERAFNGRVLDVITSNEQSDKVNDDIRVRHRISILADAYLLENFSQIKYVNWMGTRWQAETVEVNRPRLVISLGGVYNGPGPTPST